MRSRAQPCRREAIFSAALQIFALILIRLLMEWGYLYFVVEKFAYAGFSLNFDWYTYLNSWLLYLCTAFLLPQRIYRPSQAFLLVLFINVILPCTIIYGLAQKPVFDMAIVILAYVAAVFAADLRTPRVSRIKLPIKWVMLIVIVVIAVLSIRILVVSGVYNFNLDFSKVYDYRHVVTAEIGGGVFRYLNIWLSKVFGPVLLVWGLFRNKPVLTFLTLALFVFWFGMTAHKSVVIFPALIIGMYVWGRRYASSSSVLIALSAVLFVSLLHFEVSDKISLPSLFVRRTFFVVAENLFDYLQFFKSNPNVYWSSSFLSGLFVYPYHQPLPLEIGQFQGSGAWINNSFIANGYAHAGVVGVVLYGIVFGLLLSVLDRLAASGVPWYVVAAAMAPSMRSLIVEADLTTGLLTHGVAPAVVLIWILSSAELKSKYVGLSPR